MTGQTEYLQVTAMRPGFANLVFGSTSVKAPSLISALIRSGRSCC
jgi:hypothetical protein